MIAYSDETLLYAGSIAASFLTVFFKGLQYKNVNGGHYKLVFINSYFMNAADVLTITLVVKGGWAIAITSGIGGSIGMILSMWLHDRFIRKSSELSK
jgi:hypothetical protein